MKHACIWPIPHPDELENKLTICGYKPADLGGEISIAFCLCNVEGSSFNLSDKVLLNGEEASCSLEKPRNEPCLTNRFWLACGRCTANGLSTFFTGTGSGNKIIKDDVLFQPIFHDN